MEAQKPGSTRHAPERTHMCSTQPAARVHQNSLLPSTYALWVDPKHQPLPTTTAKTAAAPSYYLKYTRPAKYTPLATRQQRAIHQQQL
jgi:hypothetical protein